MFFRIAIVSILLTVPQLFGAISIIYSVAPAGGGSPDNVYRYTYLLSGSIAENSGGRYTIRSRPVSPANERYCVQWL